MNCNYNNYNAVKKKSSRPPPSLPRLEQGITKEDFREEMMSKLRLKEEQEFTWQRGEVREFWEESTACAKA